MGLTAEEKERLLRALEVDREFRYALMGLLGFKEVLERITKLEEGHKEILERIIKLEERQQKLEERFVRLEERQQKLEERQQKLEERFAQLEERFAKLEDEVREFRRLVTVIAHRFGVISESGFREVLRYVVQEVFKVAEVRRWVYRDESGYVYGYPAVVEVDVVVRDGEHVLIEVKSRVSRSDVAELRRIGKLYEEVCGVRPKLAIVGGFIDPEAYEAAAKLGIELKPAIRE